MQSSPRSSCLHPHLSRLEQQNPETDSSKDPNRPAATSFPTSTNPYSCITIGRVLCVKYIYTLHTSYISRFSEASTTYNANRTNRDSPSFRSPNMYKTVELFSIADTVPCHRFIADLQFFSGRMTKEYLNSFIAVRELHR